MGGRDETRWGERISIMQKEMCGYTQMYACIGLKRLYIGRSLHCKS